MHHLQQTYPLVRNADNGRSYLYAGVYGKSLYLPLNFAVILKLFKIKGLKAHTNREKILAKDI